MSSQKNGLKIRVTVKTSVKKAARSISEHINLPKVVTKFPRLAKPVKKITGARQYFDVKRVVHASDSRKAKIVKKAKSVKNNKLVKSAKIVKIPKITREELINAESKIGAQIFGPIPSGHQREFFLYRHNYWIFYENWMEKGHKKESTIAFEVRRNGVYKNPLGSGYRKISGAELANFCHAVREYKKLVKFKLYQKEAKAKDK